MSEKLKKELTSHKRQFRSEKEVENWNVNNDPRIERLEKERKRKE